ncbi:MAG: four helix bundle protein [Candidatus Yanofskybacteria bacterium]|nr:four helix bundle protein [Candidatus Yanofskybacteria bacterium]
MPLLQKAKSVYLLWYEYYQILPKTHRHSLGVRIDALFVEIIESLATAAFLAREEKMPYVRLAIRKVDTLKVFLMILWETKSWDDKKYIALSLKIDEIGRMLGGWYGQLQKSVQQVQDKQNSPNKGEK